MFATGLDEVIVGDLQHGHRQDRQQRRCQRQHQILLAPQPGVQSDVARQQAGDSESDRCRGESRQQQHHDHQIGDDHHKLDARDVRRAVHETRVQDSRGEIGVNLHPGIAVRDGRGAQVQQAGGGGTDNNKPVPQRGPQRGFVEHVGG